MPRRITLKNYHQEAKLFTNRLIFAGVMVAVLSLCLITRLAFLQLYEHNLYTTLSTKNQLALIPVEPNRGLIYDRNGVLLAENLPAFSLDLIPYHIKDLQATLQQLQQLFHIDDEKMEQFHKHRRQHRAFEPVPLLLKLTPKQVAHFYVNQQRFPGVMINARMIRHYPLANINADVIGYVGRINEHELQHIDTTNYSATNYIGKIGIEHFYEPQLHGYVGYKQVEVNATGQMVRTIKEIAPIPGKNIYLTIDSKLQKVAHKALKGEHGAVVVIKPDSGEILALVSHPSYDPNPFINGMTHKQYAELKNSPDKPMYNRAIRGQYPLASTIKPFMGLKGLEEKIITPSSSIIDIGYFKIAHTNHIYHDWNRGGHGKVNLRKALIVSCDTFFYQLAHKLGIRKIDEIMGQFGFGQKTGVDMSEELPGILPTPEWKRDSHHGYWFTGDTILSGIGQGFMLATPLQLAASSATLANRGTRYQPHLLLKCQHTDGSFNDTLPIAKTPVVLQSPTYWETIIHDMEGVIRSTHPKGTGFRFGRHSPYTVAAKTGTAQITKPKEYENKRDEDMPKRYRDHSLFIAFAPVKHPKIAIAVIVENTKTAPLIARKVIDAYLVPHKKEKKKHEHL